MLETPAEILSHYAGAEAADSFVAYRKKHKRAALSETAATRLAKTLAEIIAQGGDAAEALGIAEERGWQTIKVEWYWNDKGNEAGAKGNPNSHATTRAITFAATARRTPSADSF